MTNDTADEPENSAEAAMGHVARILQVLTAALAASVFICIAQRLGSYLQANHHLVGDRTDWPELGWGSLALMLTMLWTAKNSVDEFRAFDKPPTTAFSLGATVLFSTCAYVALATAGSLLFDGMKPFWALAAFFGICTVWSLESLVRHILKKSDRQTIRGRIEWAVAYPICAAALVWYASTGGTGWTAILVFVPIGYFVRDAWKLKTFSTKS